MRKVRKRKVKRYDWLVDQIHKNQYQVGAEVGCAEGNTTVRLLQSCPQLRLYAVDLWGSQFGRYSSYSQEIYRHWDFVRIMTQFTDRMYPYRDRVIILRGCSWEMAEKVEEPLDFVFIDADHTYTAVKKDVQAWGKVLRGEGLISGHDCNLEGVREALNEVLPGWKYTGVDNVWCGVKEQIRWE
jgi:hypothetical protein